MNDTEQLPAAIELSGDILWGSGEIAADLGIGERKVLHLLVKGAIPARKVGGMWISRRSVLRRHFELTQPDQGVAA
jgi:hypothetical protein